MTLAGNKREQSYRQRLVCLQEDTGGVSQDRTLLDFEKNRMLNRRGDFISRMQNAILPISSIANVEFIAFFQIIA